MSELIRREDVRREIQASFDGGAFRWQDGQDLMDRINALPTASPWHSVEEPPEKDEWVLTITKSYKGARIYNISTVDSDGRWWTTSQNGMREIHYIEYWMPIEPPKEDA